MTALRLNALAGLGLPSGPIVLFALALSVGAYLLGVAVQRRTRLALANPVLIAIVLIGATLRLLHLSYATYFTGAQPLNFLLGPATVALAVPLVRAARHLRRSLLPLFASVLAGALTGMVSGYGLVRLCGGSQVLALTMLPKSVTTPIALEVSIGLGGIASLTAVLAILAGVLVAVGLSPILSWIGIGDPASAGLAAGTAGSGIGTSRALELHPVSGGLAAMAIGLNGLLTAALAPGIAAVLKHW